MNIRHAFSIFAALTSISFVNPVSAQSASIDESTPNGLIRSIVSEVMASIKADP